MVVPSGIGLNGVPIASAVLSQTLLKSNMVSFPFLEVHRKRGTYVLPHQFSSIPPFGRYKTRKMTMAARAEPASNAADKI